MHVHKMHRAMMSPVPPPPNAQANTMPGQIPGAGQMSPQGIQAPPMPQAPHPVGPPPGALPPGGMPGAGPSPFMPPGANPSGMGGMQVVSQANGTAVLMQPDSAGNMNAIKIVSVPKPSSGAPPNSGTA